MNPRKTDPAGDAPAPGDWQALADTVRLHRQRRKWTQAELAEAAGVSENTVANIESGRGQTRIPNTMGLIETALGWPTGTGRKIVFEGAKIEFLPTMGDPDRAVVIERGVTLVDDDALISRGKAWVDANFAQAAGLRVSAEDLQEAEDRAVAELMAAQAALAEAEAELQGARVAVRDAIDRLPAEHAAEIRRALHEEAFAERRRLNARARRAEATSNLAFVTGQQAGMGRRRVRRTLRTEELPGMSLGAFTGQGELSLSDPRDLVIEYDDELPVAARTRSREQQAQRDAEDQG